MPKLVDTFNYPRIGSFLRMFPPDIKPGSSFVSMQQWQSNGSNPTQHLGLFPYSVFMPTSCAGLATDALEHGSLVRK